MRECRHDFFTYWAAAAGAAGHASLLWSHMRPDVNVPRAGIAVFVVSLAVAVAIAGTDTIGRHLAIPHHRARAVYSAHLLVHVLPLVAAAVILAAWRVLVRHPATAGSVVGGLGAAAALFAAYATVPLGGTGEIAFEKVRAVYNVADPRILVASGAVLGTAGAGMAALASRGSCCSGGSA